MQRERERSTGSNLLDLLLFSGWNAYWASLRALIEDPQFLVCARLLSSSLLQYPHMSMVGSILSCWTNQTRRVNVFRMRITLLYAVEIFVCCKLYAIETSDNKSWNCSTLILNYNWSFFSDLPIIIIDRSYSVVFFWWFAWLECYEYDMSQLLFLPLLFFIFNMPIF